MRATKHNFSVGEVVGNFLILSAAFQVKQLRYFQIQCLLCGNSRPMRSERIKQRRSCGCVNFDIGAATRRHGMTSSREYRIWDSMKRRCLNPRHRQYADYGGRGITVCDRWLRFDNFFADMGPKPTGMSIERINNNGNYEPSNCRWATPAEQQHNRRDSMRIIIDGKSYNPTEIAASAGLKRKCVYMRVKYGWPTWALTLPVGSKRPR